MSAINIQDLKEQCEQSFLKELYRDDKTGQTILLDETTGRICVRKTLSVYNRNVYRWLKDHPHPHLPKIRSFYEEDGRLHVTEEYIQGITLNQYLTEKKPDQQEKIRLLLDLCDAVAHLHSAAPPIIHRDIKLSNIMVTDDGILKLIDFDAAKLYRSGEKKDTFLMGTQGSAAPEQYGFGSSDERTDVYGTGILIRDLFPDDRRFRKIADKAAALKPEERYQTIRELKEALKDAAAGRRERFRLIRKPLLPIPGFRSHAPWKMGIAIAGYCMMIITAFNGTSFRDEQGFYKLIDQLCLLAAFLTWVDICTDWTGIFSTFPFIRAESAGVRCVAKTLWCFLALVFWVLIASILQIAYLGVTGQ